MHLDNVLLGFILIFVLRVTDVTMGTMRTVYIMQGRRWLATGIGFVEVTIFIFAISQVVRHLDSPVLMLAYSGGFATGTFLGLYLEEHFAIGQSQVRIMSQSKGEDIAQALWARDFGATVVPGHGRKGPTDLIFSIVPRRCVEEVMNVASATDSHCMISVSDSRYLFRGYLGFHGKKK